jgi:protein TonB
MEAKVLVFKSWDDLVFADRNKAYGAYPLRQAYSKRIILGVGISTAVIVVMLLAGVDESVTKKIVKATPPETGVRQTIPPIIESLSKPKPPQTSTRNAAHQPVLVVREEVETPVNIDADLVEFDDNGNGSSDGTLSDGISMPIEIPEVGPRPDAVVTTAELMPAYEGGIEAMMKFLVKHLRYPAAPRRLGIDGTVYISFVVNGDGNVSQVSVLRGIHPQCDEEAVRVVSMLNKWKGGKQNGYPVSVRMVLPIKFNLQK